MPDTFTPEQISQILEEFFKVVGTRQYIGARYVPLFGRKDETSIEWDNTKPYEPLTIVLYQGNSYTSRQFVPVGVEITNQEFWAITGNYNAQVEQYRRETAAVREVADSALSTANNAQTDIDMLLPKADFSAENTVKDYVDAIALNAAQIIGDNFSHEHSISDFENATNATLDGFDSDNTVKNYVDAADALLPKADFSAENTVKDYIDTVKNESLSIGAGAVAVGNYIGRINYIHEPNKYPQSCTVLDDNTILAVISNSNTTNDCTLYEIDINTKKITAKYSRDWAHCNGAAYNKNVGKLYVCPASAYPNETDINSIYVCNRYTYNIERVIDTPFRPHAIAYDQISDKMYVVAHAGNTNTFSIYEMNVSNDTFTKLFDGNYNDIASDVHSVAVGGYQEIAAYDNVIYYLLSNSRVNYIVKFNLSGEVIGVVNVAPDAGYYEFVEGEGLDFFADGTAMYMGICNVFTQRGIAALVTLNLNGKSGVAMRPDSPFNTRDVTSLNATLGDDNYRLDMTGGTSDPYTDFNEAAFVCEKSLGKQLVIRGAGEYDVSVSRVQLDNINMYSTAANVFIVLKSKLSMINTTVGSRSHSNPITFVKNAAGMICDVFNCVFRGINISVPDGFGDSMFFDIRGVNVFNNINATNESTYTNGLVQGGDNAIVFEYNCTGLTYTAFPNYTIHSAS